MENEITAHKAGTIVELPIAEGAAIQAGAPIATIRARARELRRRAAVAVPLRAPRHVLAVQPSLRGAAPAVRQLGLGAVLGERLQIGGVLLEDRQRPVSAEHRSVAGDDVLGIGDERAQALERGEIGMQVPSVVERGQLDRSTGSRRRRARAPRGSARPCRRRCGPRRHTARARARRRRSGRAPAAPGPIRARAVASRSISRSSSKARRSR